MGNIFINHRADLGQAGSIRTFQYLVNIPRALCQILTRALSHLQLFRTHDHLLYFAFECIWMFFMLEKIKLQEFESFKLFSYGWTNIEIQTVRTDSHSSSLKAVCHSSVIKGWWFEACNTLILCGLFSRPAVMYNAVPDSGCEKNWDDITNLSKTPLTPHSGKPSI